MGGKPVFMYKLLHYWNLFLPCACMTSTTTNFVVVVVVEDTDLYNVTLRGKICPFRNLQLKASVGERTSGVWLSGQGSHFTQEEAFPESSEIMMTARDCAHGASGRPAVGCSRMPWSSRLAVAFTPLSLVEPCSPPARTERGIFNLGVGLHRGSGILWGVL